MTTVIREAYVAQVSREIGWEACARLFLDAGRAMARQAARTVWIHPVHVSIAATWEPDHQPCGRKCGACSRCIHSLAWYSRGGRPYLGAEAERARQASS